jgi:hypothetical protein
VASLDARPELAPHRRAITIGAAAGQAINFARATLEPGVAVILDPETTSLHDGAVCEIAVIDASTGKTLLNTLVNPGVPIEPAAFVVHGITDAEVTASGIPDWPTVYKRLLRVTAGKIILAYNAFTRQVDCWEWSCRERSCRTSRGPLISAGTAVTPRGSLVRDGEAGVPAGEVFGEVGVEHSGAELQEQVRTAR